MVQIKWTLQAKSDLKNIVDFISQDSIRYARKQYESIIDTVDFLTDNTKLGKIVLEKNQDNIREIQEGNYRIIYRIISMTEIHIITIHHGKKDFSAEVFDE